MNIRVQIVVGVIIILALCVIGIKICFNVARCWNRNSSIGLFSASNNMVSC